MLYVTVSFSIKYRVAKKLSFTELMCPFSQIRYTEQINVLIVLMQVQYTHSLDDK